MSPQDFRDRLSGRYTQDTYADAGPGVWLYQWWRWARGHHALLDAVGLSTTFPTLVDHAVSTLALERYQASRA